MSRILFSLVALALSAPAPAQDKPASDQSSPDRVAVTAALKEGQAAVQDGDFESGIAAFRKATELDPKNGQAWHMLGYCLHGAKRLDEALPVHLKAAEFKDVAPVATYNVACVHSLKGDKDQALTWLEKAIALGFNDAAQVEGDSDFDSLRSDPRFQKLTSKLGSAVQVYAPTTDRRSARVAWFGKKGSPGQIAIDYAVLEWQDKYEEVLDSPRFVGKKWRFGGDFWTTLDSSLPLTIAGVTVPAGYWYLTLEHRGDRKFVLGVHDPVAVRKLRIDPFRADLVQGGIEVPLQHRAAEKAHKQLAVGIAMPLGEQQRGTLTVAFGGHELCADVSVELPQAAAK